MPPRLQVSGRRFASSGPRQRTALDRRPDRGQREQRHGFSQHAGRGARQRSIAVRLRRVERYLRGSPGAAEGGGADRPAAIALRSDQACERAVRRDLRPLLRLRIDRAALFQRVRPAPGSERRLRGGDPEVDLEHDPQRACIHQRRRETTRDFCYIDNVVQANLLAATVDDPAAVNEVYNVALNERISLNELFAILRSMLEQRYPHLRSLRPIYREFRHGDARASQACIDKARRLLGYRPLWEVRQGLARSIDWYVAKLAPS